MVSLLSCSHSGDRRVEELVKNALSAKGTFEPRFEESEEAQAILSLTESKESSMTRAGWK